MTTHEIRTKLARIFRDYVDTYQRLSDRDYKDYLITLPPGARTPMKGKFFSDEYRDMFAEKCYSCREEATAVINDAIKQIRIKKAEAPADSTMNYLSLLKEKIDLNEYDINGALDLYGDNYSAYNAIKALATSRDILSVDDSALDQLERGLAEDIQPFFNKLTVFNAENGHATESIADMFEAIALRDLPDATF